MGVKQWVPPALVAAAETRIRSNRFQRFVPAISWADAVARSAGYEATSQAQEWTAPNLDSSPQIRRFTTREVQLVAAAGSVISKRTTEGPFHVLDMGGASGDYAWALRTAFPTLDLRWTVLETPVVVQQMRKAETPNWMTWTADPDEIGPTHLGLASAVLNYVPDPNQTLMWLATHCPWFIVTRLPLWPIASARAAVQRPTKRESGGSYPTWFFSDSTFRKDLRKFGSIEMSWDVPEDTAVFAGTRRDYVGLLIKSNVHGSGR